MAEQTEPKFGEKVQVYGRAVKQICGLVCCPPCPAHILAKVAFQPPRPARYEIREVTDNPSTAARLVDALLGNETPEPEARLLFDSPFANPDLKAKVEPVFIPRKVPKQKTGEENDNDISTSSNSSTDAQASTANTTISAPKEPTTVADRVLQQALGEDPVQQSSADADKPAQTQSVPLDCGRKPKAPMPLNHNKIAGCYIRTQRKKSNMLIVHCHGNAVDMGEQVPFLQRLADLLKTDIFSWDYRSYGATAGDKCTEKRLYKDVRRVFQFVQDHYEIPSERIIIYGQSIGSVAAVDLAANLPAEVQIAGVILHAPLLSAMKVVRTEPGGCVKCMSGNPLNTEAKLDRIQAKVLVIHGINDEMIPIEHGYKIYSSVNNPLEPLWVEGAGHNNIEAPQFAYVYLTRLRKFLTDDVGADVKFDDKELAASKRIAERASTPNSRRRGTGKQVSRETARAAAAQQALD